MSNIFTAVRCRTVETRRGTCDVLLVLGSGVLKSSSSFVVMFCVGVMIDEDVGVDIVEVVVVVEEDDAVVVLLSVLMGVLKTDDDDDELSIFVEKGCVFESD